MIHLYNPYNKLKSKIEFMKNTYLNSTLNFGKYKGCTYREVLDKDKYYIYWLIKDSNRQIDPRLLGLKLPSKEDILKILDMQFKDGKFIKKTIIPKETRYDWNIGHYGCSEESIEVSPEIVNVSKYSIETIIESYGGVLEFKFPYIKVEEYLKELFK